MKRDAARVIRTGRSQTVRIPKAYWFDCDEIFIERKGDRLIRTPKHRRRSWKEYFAQHSRLPADFPAQIDDPAPEPIKGL
jgi:antitoxin VapB